MIKTVHSYILVSVHWSYCCVIWLWLQKTSDYVSFVEFSSKSGPIPSFGSISERKIWQNPAQDEFW